jgi:hypothetical protein
LILPGVHREVINRMTLGANLLNAHPSQFALLLDDIHDDIESYVSRNMEAVKAIPGAHAPLDNRPSG